MKKILVFFTLVLMFFGCGHVFAAEVSATDPAYDLKLIVNPTSVLVDEDVNVSVYARSWPIHNVKIFYGDGSSITDCAGIGGECNISGVKKYGIPKEYEISAFLVFGGTNVDPSVCVEPAVYNEEQALCHLLLTIKVDVTGPPFCGDGIKNDASEECDGSDFDGKTCQDYNFNSGALICKTNCKIDTSGCSNDVPIIIPTEYPNPLIWSHILDFLEYLVIYLFRVGSGLAVLMILIGAFIMTTSSGDPIKADKGKRTVMWALIGFIVTMTVNGIIALLKSLFSVK